MIKYVDEVLGFEDYINRYLLAASYIPEGNGDLLYPRMHMFGHAMELSLKAFIASTDNEWKEIHDLVSLLNTAMGYGLLATEHEQKSVVPNLNKIYYKPDNSDWRFPSRYPRAGTGIWITPANKQLIESIRSFLNQALQQAKR